jgi:hypothetical protein
MTASVFQKHGNILPRLIPPPKDKHSIQSGAFARRVAMTAPSFYNRSYQVERVFNSNVQQVLNSNIVPMKDNFVGSLSKKERKVRKALMNPDKLPSILLSESDWANRRCQFPPRDVTTLLLNKPF